MYGSQNLNFFFLKMIRLKIKQSVLMLKSLKIK